MKAILNKKKKKQLMLPFLTLALIIGGLLPLKQSFAFYDDAAKCWKDDDPGQAGDGYYKCGEGPASSCEWVSGKKA